MIEEEARAWLRERARAPALAKLDRYVDLLLTENERQNLISANSAARIWNRHIVDSAQLAEYASAAQRWLDVGSGPGLPGLVLAILTGVPTILVEPRTRRAAFLESIVAELGLDNVQVEQKRIEHLRPGWKAGAITARAFSSLDRTFQSTIPFADLSTIWVLPRGQRGRSELEQAKLSWQGVFHVEQSVTDPEAVIIVASELKAKHR